MAGQHVEKLGQFIETSRPQEAADRRDAIVPARRRAGAPSKSSPSWRIERNFSIGNDRFA